MGCRSARVGEEAVAKLRAALSPAAASSAELSFLAVDLGDLTDVRRAAAGYVASGRRLDVLINNAGVMAVPLESRTSDGFDQQFGVNHLVRGVERARGLPVPGFPASDDACTSGAFAPPPPHPHPPHPSPRARRATLR